MADLVPTTKLDAVNWALGKLSFPPVSTLEGAIGRDAAVALASIDAEARALCRRGFWFSTRDVTLTPNDEGYLLLATETLNIGPPHDKCSALYSPSDWLAEKPVMRQGKVYSVIRQSYVWTRSLTVGVTEALDFEDLPEEARTYLQVHSALELNQAYVRSDEVKKELAPMLNSAWLSLVDADIQNSSHRFI